MPRMTLLPVIAGPALLLAVGYGATVVVPALSDETTTRTEATRPHSVGGVKGGDLYAANGCVYCHSLQRRDAFGDGGLGPAVTGPADDLNKRPAMLGSARYGP